MRHILAHVSLVSTLFVAGCGSDDPVLLVAPDAAVTGSDAGTVATDAAFSTDAPAVIMPPPSFRTPTTCTVTPSANAFVATTDRGLVRGKAAGPTIAFLGIPFAKPPLGSLRFAAPQDTGCFVGERDATQYGSSCVQQGVGVQGSEDCLFLNVWTPDKAATAKLPILFFIHGGAEVAGSANQSTTGFNIYDGEAFAAKTRSIVVSTNYRLGPLGFMAHPALTAESGKTASGNYAIMDLVLALEWIKANAAAFGGDASRIMIFGESAGALNTCALMASPLAKGLFSSALMESGGCDAPLLAAREKTGTALAIGKGCSGSGAAVLDCLRKLPAGDLMPNPASEVSFFNNQNVAGSPWDLSSGLTVDGYVLKKSPLETLRAGEHTHVPFVIGSNAHEAELFIPAVVNTCIDYALDMTNRFGADLATKVRAKYPCLSYPLARYAEVDVMTDVIFTCHARRIARAVAMKQTEPVYRYLYKHVTPALALLRAAHATELPFVFDTLSGLGSPTALPGERTMIGAFQGYWSSLARSSDPNAGGAGLLPWPRYTTGSESLLVIDTALGTDAGFKNDKCDFWDALYDTP
jgi:para-nitrobenzyl esterase